MRRIKPQNLALPPISESLKDDRGCIAGGKCVRCRAKQRRSKQQAHGSRVRCSRLAFSPQCVQMLQQVRNQKNGSKKVILGLHASAPPHPSRYSCIQPCRAHAHKGCPLSLYLSVYAEDDGVVATGVTAVHTLCHCSSCVYFSVSQGCGSSEDDKVTCFCAQHGHLFGS